MNPGPLDLKFYFSTGKTQCATIAGERKSPPPYDIKVFKGYKNVMIRRDFADFLIYHPVAIALEEYMHNAYIPDELMYATFSRINHIAEKYLPEENCIPWHGRLVIWADVACDQQNIVA